MRMLTKANRPLLVLNLALLAALLGLMYIPGAQAQNANTPAGSRNRGDYTMISGRTNAGGADAIYVLDSANQELVALRWDAAKQSLTGIGYRNLSADAKSVPGR
ncbi:MAG: hypothetical protein NTV94_06155 [Planctomycetota bacterium]|nr:hypothetical protein [Planctomycetota bacterium]